MKQLLLFTLLSVFMLPVFAQDATDNGPQTRDALLAGMTKIADEISDFTITDSDGVTWNLYEQLDAGKTVFLDLFFVN
jgi:hypothetical protein